MASVEKMSYQNAYQIISLFCNHTVANNGDGAGGEGGMLEHDRRTALCLSHVRTRDPVEIY